MNIRFLLALLLSACRNDAAKLSAELDAIEADYNETEGGKDFPRTKFVIVVDDSAVETRQVHLGQPTAMYYDSATQVITVPTHTWFEQQGYPDEWYLMSLAHEMGHAMGLTHASQGLMSPNGDLTCIGREGACLYEAMAFAGKVLLLPND